MSDRRVRDLPLGAWDTWLLLRHATHLRTPAERGRLRELLRANRALFIGSVRKDDGKRRWPYRSPHAARRFWRAWKRRALRRRIPALARCTTMRERPLEGILRHCRYPIHSGVLEGGNNKSKVLKRVAEEYRDDASFFRKIRAAFPGIPG